MMDLEVSMTMIAKDMLPWVFVKRAMPWTPYVRLRIETVRRVTAAQMKENRQRWRRPPLGTT